MISMTGSLALTSRFIPGPLKGSFTEVRGPDQEDPKKVYVIWT